MTQLRIKNRINHAQMGILIGLLRSWNLETEIVAEEQQITKKTINKRASLLTQARGMWADYDIDVKHNREQARERRTITVSAL